ncbi:MAK10-like protein [Tanacetum coccineum]
MGDENPIRSLGDYSKPSHEGYKNTIELPVGNNVDFLKLVDSLDLDGENNERTRLRLFQFSLRDQASNWLERLPAGSISIWENLTTRLLAQFFPPRRTVKLRNDILMFQQHHEEPLSEAWTPGGKLRNLNAEESWALLEDLALYDNESWNNPRDFAKPIKATALPQDVSSISDRRLIELENQPKQASVEYASSRTDEAGEGLVSEFMASQEARLSKFEADFKRQQGRGFLATANAVIDYRMAKIAVGEGITRSIFSVKGVDLGEEEAPYWTTLGKMESYKPRPSSDGISANPPYYVRKDFLDCLFPENGKFLEMPNLILLRIP